MTTPQITPPPAVQPDIYGGDPALFDATMHAWLLWQAVKGNEDKTVVDWMNERANYVAATANAAQADRALCATALAAILAQSPVTNAAAAAASAAAAAVYAAQAQATNPDSPIRLNPRRITANFTVPSGSNAASVGPIAVADGVVVTVSDNAAWSIH